MNQARLEFMVKSLINVTSSNISKRFENSWFHHIMHLFIGSLILWISFLHLPKTRFQENLLVKCESILMPRLTFSEISFWKMLILVISKLYFELLIWHSFSNESWQYSNTFLDMMWEETKNHGNNWNPLSIFYSFKLLKR